MFADPDALAALRARLGNQQPQGYYGPGSSSGQMSDSGGFYGPSSQMAKDMGTGPGPGGDTTGMPPLEPPPQQPPIGIVPQNSPLGQLGAQGPTVYDDDWDFNPSNSITPQAKQAAIKQLIASLAGYQ